MLSKKLTKNRIGEFLCLISFSVLLSAAVIPGFRLIGNLMLQVLATVASVLCVLFVTDRSLITPRKASIGLILSCSFWICLAFYKQIALHIKYRIKSANWVFVFYYDKPALLFVLMVTVILFYSALFLKKYDDSGFISSYKAFQKNTFVLFLVFYVMIFLYGFVIIRHPGIEVTPPNFVPFQVIRQTFFTGKFDYENVTLFFGNIFIFFPMGVIAKLVLMKKKRPLLYLFPVVVSTSIEVLQLFLRCGHFDVDDILLNVFGYFLGVLTVSILNKITTEITGGRFNTLFIAFVRE